jgi:N-acetylneuraminate synthase
MKHICPISIGRIIVGHTGRCMIIAEAGVNHNGDLSRALQMVDAAADAGADAIKFQTFRTELLATKSAQKADYQKRHTGKTETQFDMLKKLELPDNSYQTIISRCRKKGIIFLSTPFDKDSVDLLESLNISAYKLPSGELTNLELLDYVSRLGKPIILSTGMASVSEIRTAVNTIRSSGNRRIVLLHCVSNYPADPADINLRAMRTMEKKFGFPVGYSDHSTGIDIAIAAVALGACVIEKHFTLDRGLPGPDHKMSLLPSELVEMVRCIRRVELALGNGIKTPSASERNTAVAARRSIHYKSDLVAGRILSEDDICFLRPGDGISPADTDSYLGKRLFRGVKKGAKMTDLDFMPKRRKTQ